MLAKASGQKFVQSPPPSMQRVDTDQSEFELQGLRSKEVGIYAFAALIVTEDHPTVGDQWRVIGCHSRPANRFQPTFAEIKFWVIFSFNCC